MILKYRVPEKHRKIYDNKKIMYCEILQKQEIKNTGITIYRAKMINYNNFTNIFSGDELEKLNILDKIIVRRYGK